MLLQKEYYPNVSQKAKGEENEVIIFRTIRSCRRHITTAKGSLLASKTELFFWPFSDIGIIQRYRIEGQILIHCKYIDCKKHNFLMWSISHALPVPFCPFNYCPKYIGYIVHISSCIYYFEKKNHNIQVVVCTLEILKITTFRGIFKNTSFRGISLTVPPAPPHNLHKNIHIYNVGWA